MAENTELPKKVFERDLGQISLRDLFEKNEGKYVNIDTTCDRSECKMKYRIPLHQRYHKWNHAAKETVIDSHWKNYIIGNISLAQHVDMNDGTVYYNIEDGHSRLTVIQEYLDDKFKFKGKLYSERTSPEQERFLSYIFATDTTTPSRTRPIADQEITTIDDHYYENFDRINRGKALDDNDKYWCKKNKPMVALAIKLIEKCNDNYPFMKTDKFNKPDKDGKLNRKPLEEFATMVGSIIYGVYKKSYSRHYENIGKTITDENEGKVYDFMKFYKDIYDTMIDTLPKILNEHLAHFNNPGKFLGMISMDYNDSETTLEYKKEMWVKILNTDRISSDFMKGTQTLWFDFKDGDKKNQEYENIKKRLVRVREFHNRSGRGASDMISYNEIN
jgi:hypothetical protein